MTELNDLMGEAQTSPVTLNDIVGTPLTSIQPPMSAIRNRAATLALSADPDKAMDNYQIMVSEAEQGKDEYTKHVDAQVKQSVTDMDRKTAFEILAEPRLPYEQKAQALEFLKSGPPALKDTSQIMYGQLASKASEGEGIDEEDARINATSRAIQEVYEYRTERQRLINAHAAGLRDMGPNTMLEALALMVLPFGTNIAAAKEAAGRGESALGAFLLPGTSFQNARDKLENLPVEARREATENALNNLKNTSGIIFSDNDFQEFTRAQQLLEDGGYSNFDKWLDNLTGLLDIVGLGAVIRGPKKAAVAVKGAKNAGKIEEAPAVTTVPTLPAGTAPRDFTMTLAPKRFEDVRNEVGAFQQKAIERLEQQKANLLGEAGSLAGKGDVARMNAELTALRGKLQDSSEEAVKSLAKELQKTEKLSYKEAVKEAGKRIKDANSDVQGQITRLENQVESNRKASTLSQRIDTIEKEIEQLKGAQVGMPTKKTEIADVVSRIRTNSVIGTTNPLSPHGTAKQTNPAQARSTFETILNSEGDDIAQGLAGASKQDTVASDIMPKAVTESGRVSVEPVDIQRTVRRSWLPEKIADFFKTTGRLDFTAAEKAAIRANIVRDFETAAGLTMHESMGGFRSSFETKGGFVEISGVYGKPEGAWSNAKDAVEQTKFALKHHGIVDDQITLLKSDGVDYVPVKLEDVKDSPGSYMVRVSHRHEFSHADVNKPTDIDPTNPVRFEGISTILNFVDRMPIASKFQGQLSAWMADAASRIDPKITNATTSATDYEARFEKLMLAEAAKFSDLYKKLSADSKARVDKYVMDANFNQTKMDILDMKTRLGMSDAEIDSVRAWREYWDGQFYLENSDLVRQLNEQGYQLFKNTSDEFFVKPVAKNQNIGSVYDPSTQTIVRLTQQELDDLYNTGGNYAKFRRPVDFNGVTVEHMIVRNTPTEYSRKFNPTDMVLNYREGYFTVHYDKPRFIDEYRTQPDGSVIKRAIAVAKDSVDAEGYVTRANQNAAAGVEYKHRADDRALRRSSDDWFDLESARGRIAQRHRGKNLEDAVGNNQLDARGLIEDPVTSAIKSAKSIAGRMVTRPVLETSKQRIMQQFWDLMPSDGMGGKKWPTDVSQIGEKGAQVTSEVADARTNWAYINYMENGYINGMDEFSKQLFSALAEKSGEWGISLANRGGLGETAGKALGYGQRGADEMAQVRPTAALKQGVFTAYIASFPHRQWIVQWHQSIRTFAYNPRSWFNGNIVKLPGEYTYYVMTGKDKNLYNNSEFIRFVDNSGIMDAVDKQSLVRETLLDATARGKTVVGKSAKTAGKVFEVSRKVGFDIGEQINMLGHMAAVFDKYKRLGKNVNDVDVQAEMMSEARAVSYEMNFAGDMPYNQTSPAFFLQFLQVPHKAFLQTVNRKLSKWERLKLLGFDMMMWGPPILLTNEVAEAVFGEDILPEDKKLRDLLVDGAESYALNKMIRDVTGEEGIDIDFSSLAPTDYLGFTEMVRAFYSEGLMGMLANSPGGQLFFSEQGRVRNALGTTLRFMRWEDPVGESPETFTQTMIEWGKVFSGFNATYTAYLMLEAQKRFDAYGRPTGDMDHAIQALAQAFGFGDMDAKRLYQLSKATTQTIKEREEEVLKVYRQAMRYANNTMNSGIGNAKQMNSVINFALSKYKYDPFAQQVILKQLNFDLADPEQKLAYRLLKFAGMPGMESVISEIKLTKAPEEEKQKVIDALLRAKNDYERMNKEK